MVTSSCQLVDRHFSPRMRSALSQMTTEMWVDTTSHRLRLRSKTRGRVPVVADISLSVMLYPMPPVVLMRVTGTAQ